MRFAAARATVSFLLANDSEVNILNHFRDLLPAVLQVIIPHIERPSRDHVSCLTLLKGKRNMICLNGSRV